MFFDDVFLPNTVGLYVRYCLSVPYYSTFYPEVHYCFKLEKEERKAFVTCL